MARTDTLTPDAAGARATEDAGTTAVGAAAAPSVPPGADATPAALAAFRAGRSEADRTADLLAFAIAAERGLAPTPDAVERARREADSVLGDYSIRYLHNNVEQIRQEAIAAQLGRFRQPPGFAALVAANLVALAAAAVLGAWLWARPDVRAAAAGLLGG